MKRYKHGHTRRDDGRNSPEYRTWCNMRSRCKSHPRYTKRGIKVCERWQGSDGFVNFLKDMGEKPSEEYSIDRINNDGDYEPGNCRWATLVEQARNKTSNSSFTYRGEIKTAADLSEENNIPYNTLLSRLSRGWSVERAIEGPIQKKNAVSYMGVSIKELSERSGICYSTIYRRIKEGWSIDRLLKPTHYRKKLDI